MGAHECLARAVAASNAREGVRGCSPIRHALGSAPDLDGRFSTLEYEALPTVQAELVDETYGNSIKRMQDLEVNFHRWTYQNRVSRAFELQEQKNTCVFARNICLLLAQGQERDKKILQGHRLSPLYRNQKRQ